MATVREIARKANVSAATVSRVLNAREYVKQSVRECVMRAARELGYRTEQPNVAVIIHDFPEFFGYTGNMLNILLRELAEKGFHAVIIQHRDLPLLSVQPLAGAIALVLDNGLEQSWGKAQHLPLVCLNTRSRNFENIYNVTSDNEQGITLAMDHFAANGHRKIAYAAFEKHDGDYFLRDNSDIRERYDSYLRYLASHPEFSAPFPVCSDGELDRALAGGYRAILAVGEINAVPIYAAMRKRNLRIPEDVSIISFYHENLTPYLTPEPTVIGQDLGKMAATAVELLDRLIHSRGEGGDIRIAYFFREGKSVRDLRVSSRK